MQCIGARIENDHRASRSRINGVLDGHAVIRPIARRQGFVNRPICAWNSSRNTCLSPIDGTVGRNETRNTLHPWAYGKANQDNREDVSAFVYHSRCILIAPSYSRVERDGLQDSASHLHQEQRKRNACSYRSFIVVGINSLQHVGRLCAESEEASADHIGHRHSRESFSA